jgi:hypothetical protein
LRETDSFCFLVDDVVFTVVFRPGASNTRTVLVARTVMRDAIKTHW